jgi:branched-chain amino acid transport system ATP-binding protein
MFKVEDIHTYYGSSHVLQGITMELKEGEQVCLLGRNGAGKTTTLKSIMGIVPPVRGSIEYQGRLITGMKPHQIARLGIGYVPEDRRIYPDFTVVENLQIACRKPRTGGWDIAKVLQLFPNLEDKQARLGLQLSGGEQQMLAIARTLMGNPQFLLLDEPAEGLAPLIVSALAEALNEIKRRGLSLLLSEQNARFAIKMADRAYVIDKGRVIFEGPISRMMESEEEMRRFLVL